VFDRAAHIGVHRQKQTDLHWIGVALPVGKLTAAQMSGLAAIAQQMGDGDIRLTVWQNLLISGVPTSKLPLAEGRNRGTRADHQGELDPRRPRRLHRQHGLPVFGLRHQTPRRGDRALVRGARRA
jgi:sulfite reductase beta subunit-like hemoprotein